MQKLCSIQDCTKPDYCRTWCRSHYCRWQRTGDPNFYPRERKFRDHVDIFSVRVRITGFETCWEWIGFKSSKGYGRISLKSIEGQKTYFAHRWAYEALVGEIPEGLVVDHLCRNRACVNPRHLELVTPEENTRRGTCEYLGIPKEQDNRGRRRREQTHCISGHEFTPENTYRRPNGTRVCRSCSRIRDSKRKRTRAW